MEHNNKNRKKDSQSKEWKQYAASVRQEEKQYEESGNKGRNYKRK